MSVESPFDPEVPWWDPGADGSVNPFEDAVLIGPVEVRKGSRVRLRPGQRSDAQDIFLEGATAVVQGVFHDVDGDVHVAVSVDGDPATELNEWHGRYRYFRPEEIEPVARAGPRILVAGIGNIFLGDDGFGVEVTARLAGTSLPTGVKVEDFGIRGVHLAYELLEGYDMVVLIDALPRGDPPGTLSVMEADQASAEGTPMDAHSMNPMAVLAMAADLGCRIGRVLVVGCEPAEIEERIGLSDVVAGAVDEAARLVLELVENHMAVAAGKEH